MIHSTIYRSLLVFTMLIAVYSNSHAYSCNRVFKESQRLIKQAESHVRPDTDANIKRLIHQAKQLSMEGLSNHKGAKHLNKRKQKMAHSEAVRKGEWAVSLARQALFLLTGKPNP